MPDFIERGYYTIPRLKSENYILIIWNIKFLSIAKKVYNKFVV